MFFFSSKSRWRRHWLVQSRFLTQFGTLWNNCTKYFLNPKTVAILKWTFLAIFEVHNPIEVVHGDRLWLQQCWVCVCMNGVTSLPDTGHEISTKQLATVFLFIDPSIYHQPCSVPRVILARVLKRKRYKQTEQRWRSSQVLRRRNRVSLLIWLSPSCCQYSNNKHATSVEHCLVVYTYV